MGPTWGRQDPRGPHVGHLNLAIWVPHVKAQAHKQLMKKVHSLFIFHMIVQPINVEQRGHLYTSMLCLTCSVYVLVMTSQSIAQSVMRHGNQQSPRSLSKLISLDVYLICVDIRDRSYKVIRFIRRCARWWQPSRVPDTSNWFNVYKSCRMSSWVLVITGLDYVLS